MKKTILFTGAFALLMFVGCKNPKAEEVVTEEDAIETMDEHADHHSEVATDLNAVLSNSWIGEIETDNGQKWEANAETTEGVENMLALINQTQTQTLEDYHQLGSKLNDEKNYIIKECTMEGPSHDNLHVFLHPLIDKVSALQNSKSTSEAEEIVESMEENLQKYYDYFN